MSGITTATCETRPDPYFWWLCNAVLLSAELPAYDGDKSVRPFRERSNKGVEATSAEVAAVSAAPRGRSCDKMIAHGQTNHMFCIVFAFY